MKKNLLLIPILLVIANLATAQCDINPVSAKLCKGESITFTIAAPSSSYNSIKWKFGDGDSSIQKTSIIKHQYDTFGSFECSVTLYDITGNILCGPKFSSVQVFDLPAANFGLISDSIQHFSQNSFNFKDASVPGSNNAPIQSRKWYFGDGDSSAMANPTHFYSGCGSYSITLIIHDTNACQNALYKPDYIITTGPEPKFIPLNVKGCVPLTLFIKDFSKDISKWEFIKGDGTKSIFLTRPFDSIFSYSYLTAGAFYTYLIGYDSAYHTGLGKWLSCSAKYADPADSTQPHFKIIVKPIYHSAFKGDTLIRTGDTAIFIDLCDSHYDTLIWYWDDGSNIEVRGRGNATHVYNLPAGIDDKIYTVSLSASGPDTICVDRDKYWDIRVKRWLGAINDKEADQIKVFPNPFTGQTKIILPPNSKPVSAIYMYDLNGKRVQADINISGKDIIIYRNKLMPGAYLLKIITDRVYMGKVMVE